MGALFPDADAVLDFGNFRREDLEEIAHWGHVLGDVFLLWVLSLSLSLSPPLLPCLSSSFSPVHEHNKVKNSYLSSRQQNILPKSMRLKQPWKENSETINPSKVFLS